MSSNQAGNNRQKGSKLEHLSYRVAMLISILLLAGSMLCYAQDTTNADGLFEAARKAAADNKNFPEAIRLAKKVLVINPAYTDVVIFTGRVYTWNKQADSGRVYLDKALQQTPVQEDAFMAYSDLEFWSKNNREALSVTQTGLGAFPGSKELLLRKARILEALKDYRGAVQVTDTLLEMDRHNAEIRAFNQLMRDQASQSRIAINVDYAHFDKQFKDDWYFTSVEYTGITPIGPVVARVNYANRFKQGGLLMELDAYPRISRTFYMYVNGGYSADVGVFPQFRSGLSLFANLPHAFEAEGGGRYLYYNSQLFFYTLYAGKYYKNFLFSARTYLNPFNDGVANAAILTARYYYGTQDDYVNLSAGTGISPDNRALNLQVNNTGKLKSYSAELIVKHAIRRLNVVSFNISLLNQEYFPGLIGNQVQVGLGYMRHF